MKLSENIDAQINEIKQKMNDPMLCLGTAVVYSRVSGYDTDL